MEVQRGDRGISSPGRPRGATWSHRGATKVPRPTGSIASDVCDCILSWVARKTCWWLRLRPGQEPNRAHDSRAESWESRGRVAGRVSQALRTGRDEAVMIHAWGFALVGILGRR